MNRRIRVLVVDDSVLFAEAVSTTLAQDAAIAVVGRAADGAQAVRMTHELRPDVITMDLHMPVLGGLEAIEQIMSSTPTPILVLTADPGGEDGQMAMDALGRGAFEVMRKPSAWPTPEQQAAALVQTVRFLSTVPAVYRPRRAIARQGVGSAPRIRGAKIVAVAASTGGPSALATLLSSLPQRYPLPIVIVQHLAPGFAGTLMSWLDAASSLEVKLGVSRMVLGEGMVFIAPDDAHMTVRSPGVVIVEPGPAVGGHLPSANLLFESVAKAYGADAVGVVLSGMGDDGVRGLKKLREAGGLTVAQDEQTSVVWGMPKAAVERGAARLCLPLDEICALLGRLGNRDAPSSAGMPAATPGRGP
jgi:two-component system, chemotaxis family, protein-glutamate methylesterase/glutaminase